MIALIILFYSIKLYINYNLYFICIFKILVEMIAEAWQRKKKKKIMSETFGTKLLLNK